MDSELVRFRVDKALRAKADQVCAGLGRDLHDVLRAVVTRIARDGALPFTLEPPASAPPAVRPFGDYDPRLWSGLKPQLDAELAVSLLVRFIADRSARLADAADASDPDAELIELLTQERADALTLRRSLDLADPAAVARVIARYAPLVRPEA